MEKKKRNNATVTFSRKEHINGIHDMLGTNRKYE